MRTLAVARLVGCQRTFLDLCALFDFYNTIRHSSTRRKVVQSRISIQLRLIKYGTLCLLKSFLHFPLCWTMCWYILEHSSTFFFVWIHIYRHSIFCEYKQYFRSSIIAFNWGGALHVQQMIVSTLSFGRLLLAGRVQTTSSFCDMNSLILLPFLDRPEYVVPVVFSIFSLPPSYANMLFHSYFDLVSIRFQHRTRPSTYLPVFLIKGSVLNYGRWGP